MRPFALPEIKIVIEPPALTAALSVRPLQEPLERVQAMRLPVPFIRSVIDSPLEVPSHVI